MDELFAKLRVIIRTSIRPIAPTDSGRAGLSRFPDYKGANYIEQRNQHRDIRPEGMLPCGSDQKHHHRTTCSDTHRTPKLGIPKSTNSEDHPNS